MRVLSGVTFPLWLASLAVLAASHGQGASAAQEELPLHFVDVTRASALMDVPPVLSSESYDPATARDNSQRLQAILRHPRLGTPCVVYFPAGTYHFQGAAEGWTATLETTAPYQTVRGAGMHATRILQHDRTVASTVRVRHSNVAVEELFIGSGDSSDRFTPAWEAPDERHQTAIHLDAPRQPSNPWATDPRVRHVAINSYGNNILQSRFSRPFSIGIRITGAWLNVLIDEIWMKDTAIGISVCQGAIMAGPAKIMRVNHYATHAPDRTSTMWTTFFDSQGHFMEQVELIHNTFIGAQFICMDGRALPEESRTSPAYDMVIDHNYINVHDVGQAPEAREPGPGNSGIYLNLPPTQTDSQAANYSRDIRFTNNSCTGRAPSRGAFFYVEGMCRGLTFSHNDISSPGIDKAIYIRATQRLEQDGVSRADDTAIRDVKITHNYFRSFRNIITIGGDQDDPERLALPKESPLRGRDDDPCWVQRVVVAHNQNMMEGATDTLGLTTCYLHRVRQAVVESNTFTETAGSALVVRNTEEVSVTGNSFRGLNAPRGRQGIALINTRCASVTGNILAQFGTGFVVEQSSHVTFGHNVVRDAETAVLARANRALSLLGNQISGAERGIETAENVGLILSTNQISAAQGIRVPEAEANRSDHVIDGNVLLEP